MINSSLEEHRDDQAQRVCREIAFHEVMSRKQVQGWLRNVQILKDTPAYFLVLSLISRSNPFISSNSSE